MVHVIENKCDYCGTCVAVCPVDCINLTESDIAIDDYICIDCDLCIDICPIEVLYQENAKKV
tara:strand:+ start:581 stop:766 length:186 start_codon:yes stop_codon:yes gene_type:complete